MRSAILALACSLATAAGCSTKSNDAVCCVTEADCARLGLDELRRCDVGQACRDFRCVAAECATAADCTDPAAPACALGLCVASCTADADCTGAASGPHCAPDGACVGCVTEADCGGDTPYCDGDARSCRGCAADAECGSGVCIEADARCAAEAEVVYTGSGVDTGTCTRAAPCATLEYALQQLAPPARRVIHLLAGSIVVDRTASVPQSTILDGVGTVIRQPSSMPLFELQEAGGDITIEGVSLTGTATFPAIPLVEVRQGTSLRIVKASLERGLVSVAGGGLELRDARLIGASDTVVTCSGGSVSAARTRFEYGVLNSSNCVVHVARSHFQVRGDGSVLAAGGIVVIENNLIEQANEGADTMTLSNVAAGSAVRFNTFVSTSGIASDGVALDCSGAIDVTNNVFAYGSMHPMGPSEGTVCSARFSLFDAIAVARHTEGEGNRTADAATFFVNRSAGDYHLAAGSPARGLGVATSTVTADLDGNSRPAPVGSDPDVGCYEAP